MEKKRQAAVPIESFFKVLKKEKNEDQKNGKVEIDKETEINGKNNRSKDDSKVEDNKDEKYEDIDFEKLIKISDDLKPLLKLELTTMHKSWLKNMIEDIQKPYFIKLKQFLASEAQNGKKVFPPAEEVYSWSRYTPFEEVKVVIIGQDPYHNDNQAHGLCFSVNKGTRLPPSLRNIYKEIKNEYPEFAIPKHGYLASWAKQGVLLLNAALTVQAHNANSHANKGWEQFTDSVIQHLNSQRRDLVFIFWGSYAQKKGKLVDKKKHLVLTGIHPSPLSAERGFFGCNHFKKTNEYLKSKGKDEINWLIVD